MPPKQVTLIDKILPTAKEDYKIEEIKLTLMAQGDLGTAEIAINLNDPTLLKHCFENGLTIAEMKLSASHQERLRHCGTEILSAFKEQIEKKAQDAILGINISR